MKLRMPGFIRRLFLTVRVYEVSSDDAEAQVMAAVSNQGLLDELYEFGGLMVDEVFSRTAQLDAKATSLLGWAIAALAFLLIGVDRSKTTDTVDNLLLVA